MKISDLFGPRWKHSDPTVRRQAIDEFSARDRETLEIIATTDPDPALRLLAIDKVHDARALERIAGAAGQPREVLDHLHRSLDRIFRDVVLGSRDIDQATPALARISTDSVLADIAIATDRPDIRLGAINRINTVDELCRVAEQNCGKEAGTAIIARLDDSAALERLAESGSNKSVRREAREKLDARSAPVQRSTEHIVAKRDAELRQLVAQAREWAQSWNFAFFQEKFAAADDRWRQLDPKQEHADRAEFTRLRASFDKRLKEFNAKREAEIREAEARLAVIEKRETLCDRVDWLLQPAAPDKSLVPDVLQTSLDSLRREWAELPDGPGTTEPALTERFEAAGRQLETLIRRERQDRGALDRLTAIVAQIEALAAQDELAPASQVSSLVKEARHFTFSAADPAELLARLDAAATTLGERRKAAEAAAYAAEITPRQAILAQMQALVEQPESRESAEAVKAAQQAVKDLPRSQSDAAKDIERQIRDIANAFFEKRREHHEEQDVERWANLTAKELLVTEAATFDGREDFHELAKAIQDIQKRWKAIGHVPRENADEIWERFHGACNRNYERCKAYFDQQNAEREAAAVEKRRLIEVVVSLKDSSDWGPAGDEIKAAQARWKELGPAPRKDEQALWEQFRDACDTFFNRRSAHFDAVNASRPANTEAKQRLVEEAQAIAAEPNWRDADQLHRLQLEWKAVGHADREKEEELWQIFKAAGDTFYAYLDQMRPTFLAQKQALLAELEAALEKAADPAADRDVARTIMDLQKQWREIGPGPRDAEKPIWDAFHSKCDAFFTERKQALAQVAEEREANAETKRALVEKAEALRTSTEWRETADKLKALQREWKDVGPAPHKEDQQLWERFRGACDQFFTARQAFFGEREDNREANLQAKEELCARLEELLGMDAEPDPALDETADAGVAADGDGELVLADLAKELTIALQANFTAGDVGASGSVDRDVREIQARWKEIGPVPREHDRALWKRYRGALDHYYGQRQNA